MTMSNGKSNIVYNTNASKTKVTSTTAHRRTKKKKGGEISKTTSLGIRRHNSLDGI